MLKARVITASILLLLLLAALFLLPSWAWGALVVLMVMQGTSEWARLSGLGGRSANLYWGLTLLSMLALLWLDGKPTEPPLLFIHLSVYLVSAILWLLVVPAWLIAGWRVKHPLAMALVGWAVLIPTGLAMVDLRAMDAGPWLLLAIMALVWVADISAYFAGRRFGKNKLAPSISPGKTWEGVIGALFGVTVYVVAAWALSPYFATRSIVLPLLFAAWWWVALAVMGDLFESAIKRQAGVKDSGALLPGHGGLLDRIDALTSTLPLAAFVLLTQVKF